MQKVGALAEHTGAHILGYGPAEERREVHLVQSSHDMNERVQNIVRLGGEVARAEIHRARDGGRLRFGLSRSGRIELECDTPLASEIAARPGDAPKPHIANHDLSGNAADSQ